MMLDVICKSHVGAAIVLLHQYSQSLVPKALREERQTNPRTQHKLSKAESLNTAHEPYALTPAICNPENPQP